MTTTEVKKQPSKNNYYARRHFDGKDGIPKMTFYLNRDGEWLERLDKGCFFPSRDLAKDFLGIRLKIEEGFEEMRKLSWKLALAETSNMEDAVKQYFKDNVDDPADA